MSVAESLPVGWGRRFLLIAIAYGLPGAALWAGVGAGLNLLDARTVALIVTLCYGIAYGVVEWLRIPGLAVPGRNWQVPQSVVTRVRGTRRLLLWGLFLGSGFLTRNPYAGFGFLVLAVATPGNVVRGILFGGALGLGHGVARGVALMRDAGRAPDADYMDAVRAALQWRAVDGVLLLIASGLAAGTL